MKPTPTVVFQNQATTAEWRLLRGGIVQVTPNQNTMRFLGAFLLLPGPERIGKGTLARCALFQG